MEFMQNVKKKRESCQFLNDVNEDTSKVTETSDVLKTDNESNDSTHSEHIKLESIEKLDLGTKEAYSEEISKPSKKRRGLTKGSSFLGKLDKKSKVIIGNCKCPLCKEEFSITNFASERLYRTHLYSHGVRRFSCECEKSWNNQRDLKLHIYINHRGNFHCDVCRCLLKTESDYETHIRKHEKKEPSICDDCGYTSLKDQIFHQHVKYHHDKDIYVCELCSQEYTGKLKLMVHIRRFHAEKKPCPWCGKMVKSMWLHKKNMHTDNIDKKYQCEKCGKGFIEKGKLEIHVTSAHVKNRPYACRYKCGAASNEKGNRKKHEISKHGQVWQ